MRKLEDVRRLLNAGADKVSINTAAVDPPSAGVVPGRLTAAALADLVKAKGIDTVVATNLHADILSDLAAQRNP